ncbi:MAG TPA: GFA family protein [Hyphomicrobiales bacterium]|nr:GFA family protein [Hyphomicrobiales bacterium]
MTKYTGGCQCGNVRYEVELDIDKVISCNCSRCRRLGSLLAFAPKDAFKLTAGEDATTEYKFNKHVINHLFCSACGIESYAHGTRPDGLEMVAINVRCLDNVDPNQFEFMKYDGASM